MSDLIVPVKSFGMFPVTVSDAWVGGNPGVRLTLGPDRSDDGRHERSAEMDAREARAVAAALWHFASEADNEVSRVER